MSSFISQKMPKTKEELADYQKQLRKKYSKNPVWKKKQAERSRVSRK